MKSPEEGTRILVVDDSPDTVEVLQRNLQSLGFVVFSASGVVEAIRVLEATPVEIVITDLKMPGIGGFDLIRHVRENYRETEVMMVTGYPTIEGAVKAVKTGADEFLSKPFTDEELISSVRRVLEKLYTKRKSNSTTNRVPISISGLVGESAVMQRIRSEVIKASTTSATVLVCGESGTGKEVVARAIHYNSDRASAPFVPVNCGAVPENLLESELFGYVKGAFTGANQSRAGFLQTADGGTVFLDEVSEMSPSMQVELLRVLQDGEVYMVGSRRAMKVNMRIIAATNKDLEILVSKNMFREDLFYRLNVIPIKIPPLRDRGHDVLLLLHYFAEKYSREDGKRCPVFSEESTHILSNYYWPGNVRELQNVVRRLVVMTDGDVVDVPDLPALMRFSALKGQGLTRTLAEVENEHIVSVLESVNGNRSRAARILGIDRKTLRSKLKRVHGMLP